MRIQKVEFGSAMMFLVLMLLFAAAILGDSTTEALLLTHFGTATIARMFLLNAMILFLISAMIIPVIDRVNRGLFFKTSLLIHALILFIIRGAVYFNLKFLYPFLYSYAYITKILFFLLFWTLANDLFDSRKAVRLFPGIAAGGTLGAICISFSIPWLMKFLEVENLFLIWGLLIICVYLLFIPVAKRFDFQFKINGDRINCEKRGLKSIFNDIRLLGSEPMLRNMSFLYGILFFLLVNQQYYFYSQVKTFLTGVSQAASFLGFFNGASMILTIVLQTLISGRVISCLGSTRSMLLIPVVLILNFTFMTLISTETCLCVISVFWVAVIGMGLRIAFFDSFFSPNFQMFFSSFPQEIRGRGKICIEGVVKPLSIIAAGIWIIKIAPIITDRLNFSVLIGLSGIAIFVAWRLKSKYTESLIMYFTGYTRKKNQILLDQFKVSGEPHFIEMLNEKLESEDFIVKKFIIELLADSATDEALSILIENLSNRDPQVRATVLSALGKMKIEKFKSHIIKCLSDPDNRVIANAVSALCQYKDVKLKKYIEPFVNHRYRRVRCDAMIALWPLSDCKKKELILNKLKEELSDPSSSSIITGSALYVLGELDDTRSMEILKQYHYLNVQKNCYDNSMVFDQMVNALSKKADRLSLKILLEIAEVSNKRKLSVIKEKMVFILKKIPSEIIGNLSGEKSCFKRNLILQAVFNIPAGKIEKIRTELKRIASQETLCLKKNMDIYSKLSRYKYTELFCYALMEEYIDLEIRSLVIIASLIDTSMELRKCLPQLFYKDAHERARAFEMMNNTGFLKLNRLIIKLMEKRDRLISMADPLKVPEPQVYSILERFLDSDNSWIVKCASFCLFNCGQSVSDIQTC